ncbi:intracellular septation protein [Fluviicoccus keumensis]|uniref:Inner membrane-spanning protein YciB n=1 Tax=Fluviicoccus keumensis TaxID=1435465 RepID=A0A4Q7Z3N5_9GAMM|nr:septation protein IspZ [Fluviicoccus keumensis]RZU44887.1 intracellular septation protein [Fluviicoccus keumensis]
MKAFLDFIPLFVFFGAYHLYGIYTAAAALIISSVVVYAGIFLMARKLEKGQWFTLIATIAFSSITLLLHDETWLKWKAPVINWVFALVFLGSQLAGRKPLAKAMLEQALEMPDSLWNRLNLAWVAFFAVMGGLNAWVAFHYPAYWVDFKVLGSLGFTIAFLIGQLMLLSRYLKNEEKT